MATPDRSVLHVLPHPGGGGETYVDLLDDMRGYSSSRTYLATSSRPGPVELARGLAAAINRGRRADLVHVHGETGADLCLPLLASRPSVVTFNGLHLSRRLHGIPHRAAVQSLRAVVRSADRIICVCRVEQDYLRATIGASPASRTLVIHNGVPIPPAPTYAARAEVSTELGIAES